MDTNPLPPNAAPFSPTVAWGLLALAGALEIGMAIGLKKAEGLTKLWPSVWGLGLGVASMVVLTLALRVLPAGVGYAAWTGIGSFGVAVLGMTMLGESVTAGKIACIVLIVSGVMGLHLVGEGHGPSR